MKMSKFTLALLSLSLLTACSKKHTLEEESISALNAHGSVITGWESGYSWNRSDSADFIVFRHDKSMPELTESILARGVVLVALKNVPYKPDTLLTEPNVTPFSVIPYYGHDNPGRPAYDQHWYVIPTVGNVAVKYRSNRHLFSGEPVIPPDNRVAARYFLLSDTDLQKIGHTKVSILAVKYKQLVELLGTTE